VATINIDRPETERAARASSVLHPRVTANRLAFDAAAITRPAWTRDRVPIQPLAPIETGRAVIVDRYEIQPHPHDDIMYVGALQASLAGFSLTIHRQVQADRSVAITGGSAMLTVSAYVPHGLLSMVRQRESWNAALSTQRGGERHWIYRATPRRGLLVSLELPDGIASVAPTVSTSAAGGTASIIIELTERGALSWKAALEHGSAATIAGIVHMKAKTISDGGGVMQVETTVLDTSLGELLAGRSAADIRYVDPQQTVVGKLIVVTNDLVEKVTVSLRPKGDLAPANSTFGPEGGILEVPVTTQDVDSVSLDWTTQVAFTPLGWPPIPASGQLSAANTWTDMIKPDSWVALYTLMVIPVDAQGEAQRLEDATGTTQLQAVLNFTAPYVANGLLNSSFQAEYLQPFTMALPRYPGQPFGDVVLTVFATRGGVGGMKSRKLRADEFSIVALVFPDGRVELRTGFDALPEDSSAADVLRLMGEL
jgi:hypothetical protein